MSSILNSFDQVPSRIRYFLTTATTQTFQGSGASGKATIAKSLITYADYVGAIAAPGSATSGTLLRDTGKECVVVDNTTKMHLYKLRLVQPVNGATTEGVPVAYSTASYYVRVWSSDGSGVTVARLG